MAICLLLMLVLSGCEKPAKKSVAETTVPLETQGTIIALGNSLTAGYGVPEEKVYPALLEKKLRRDGYHYRVINAGISGETSSGTLSRIQWILAQKPDIVILETGANDGLRGISTELIKENISKTIQLLQEKDVEVVLAGMQIVQNLGARYTESFAAIYPAVAKDQKIILIPFFLKGVAGEPDLNQADTIHPTAQGYEIILQTIYPHVLQAIESSRKRSTEK